MRWLGESGWGRGVEGVEVGFEGWVEGEEAEGVEAAFSADGDVVGHGLGRTIRIYGRKKGGTHEVPQGRVRPEYALSSYALAGLAHIHADGSTEKVFDVFAVVVVHEPAGSIEGYAAHGKGGEVDESDAVEPGGEEAGDVMFVADEEDAGDVALEEGDGGQGLGDAAVNEGVEPVVVVVVLVRGRRVFDVAASLFSEETRG